MVYFHHFKRANTLKLNFMMLKVKAAFYECMIRPGSDAKLFMSLEPNSNYGRPKLFRPAELIQMPILIPAKLNSKGENAHFGQTACKIHYNNLCIRFGTRKVQHLN